GIVHRDVKPANILVSSTGVVKLGDFGIAAIHDSTATSQVALSPSYAPPEAFSAGRGPSGEALDPRDERSDLYSLAATLYTLGTGRPPFDAVNPAALMNQILTELPHPVGHEQLDQFFAVAMAKSPAHRPQTARQLIEFLAPLRGDAATGATAQAGPPPPPHGIGSPAATTVPLPEVSEPTMGGHKPIDDRHTTEPRPSGGPERERGGRVMVALVALAAISAVSAGLIALWQSNRDTNTGLATVESGSVDSDAEEPSDDAGATDADQPTDEEPTDDQPTDDQPTDEEPTDEEPTEPSDDGEASQHYVGIHYELDVPAEWVLTFQDDDRGYGFRTQWKGPDGSILLIDTSPNPGGVSAKESATEQYVNNINTATRGVEQESADPDVWGFELQRSDGLRLALYLFDGANGYGIVGTHPTDPALAHAAARQAAQTIQSRLPVVLNS
ncbi:MAG: serine/threonine protein kinase, partial [Actinomycetia bacterium]|nr:serine/threonine protein kinase [Actinomycetes bacterium]